MTGQIMIVFDDGLYEHSRWAVGPLANNDLLAAFAIVTSKVGRPGFADEDGLLDLLSAGHAVINHSAEHLWLGQGQPKDGLASVPQDRITADILAAREWLNSRGYLGDYVAVPFGTQNISGLEHANELFKAGVKWMRLTVGAPVPEKSGGWTGAGGKRLYPRDYPGGLIGVTAAGDTRWPDGVMEAARNAAELGRLAVVVYHSVTSVVGEGMSITWERFLSDLDGIGALVREGKLECVLPQQLVK